MPIQDPNMAPTAPPTIPKMNGFMSRKFTPKIAGSVIPNAADKDEGIATAFVLAFLVLRPTARQAPNCAKFAAEAIGIQMFRLPKSAEERRPASMTLYIWCKPMTTVVG